MKTLLVAVMLIVGTCAFAEEDEIDETNRSSVAKDPYLSCPHGSHQVNDRCELDMVPCQMKDGTRTMCTLYCSTHDWGEDPITGVSCERE